jgi:hypothetical protein
MSSYSKPFGVAFFSSLISIPALAGGLGLSGSWTPKYSNLMSYLPMEGSFADAVGSHSGTGLNGAAFSSNSRIGIQTATLDGADDGISISSIDLGSQFSILLWAKIDGGTGTIQTLLTNSNGGASNGFRFFINSINTDDGRIKFETGNGSSSKKISSVSGAVKYGAWNHLAVTVNRATGKGTIYVNGVSVASGTLLQNFNTSAILSVGKTNSTQLFKGSIDDVAIFNVRLSATDIQTIYSQQLPDAASPSPSPSPFPSSSASPSPSPSPTPSPSPIVAANLCNGLITDKLDHPMTALAKPAVGTVVVDPQFGTNIRRISNAGGSNVIKPAYSTIPAWNADESHLILYHTGSTVQGGAGHHLYDGKTYQYIKPLDIDPRDIEQFYWHTSNPDLLMYVDSSNRLVRYHVSTGTQDIVKSFACSGTIDGGTDPMFTSWDSDLIGLRCGSQGFSYRISTNTESPRASIGNSLAPIATPSGTRMYVGTSPAQVRDLNMVTLRSLPVDGAEHSSLGRLSDGTDVLASVSFDGSYIGSLVASNLGSIAGSRVIVGPNTGYPYPPSGTHVSAISYKNPGWAAVSIVGDVRGQNLLDQEIVLANMNTGGSVCRIAHHRSYGGNGYQGYFAEPHAVISPSGTRVLYGSDWGGGTSVDSYVIELPSYQP